MSTAASPAPGAGGPLPVTLAFPQTSVGIATGKPHGEARSTRSRKESRGRSPPVLLRLPGLQVHPGRTGGASGSQAPAGCRPCPAGRGGFPRRAARRSRRDRGAGSLANAPPRAAASRVFTFKFAFPVAVTQKTDERVASAAER